MGVAVRGYRRSLGGRQLCCSDEGPSAARLGDEGALYARDGHLVAAAPDRVAAAQALVDRGVSLVLLDDGMQHRRLHRDVDIAVVDARYPAARGMIPAGERREIAMVPRRMHGVVLTHGPAGCLPTEAAARHQLRLGDLPVRIALRRPGPWHRGRTAADPPPGPVCAVAGLADPDEFFASLAPLGLVARRQLRDHAPISHRLAEELLRWAASHPLVCTAKDAVRFPPELLEQVWWRDVQLTAGVLPAAWCPPPPSG